MAKDAVLKIDVRQVTREGLGGCQRAIGVDRANLIDIVDHPGHVVWPALSSEYARGRLS